MMPLVSIITPTFQRHHFLGQILSCVLAQDYKNIEWLVLDDSPSPSNIVSSPGNENIHYTHIPTKLTIGEKRNLLVEKAKGEIIVQFDDDDYYSPSYVSSMTHSLGVLNADLINLRGWFLYAYTSRFFGYWDLMKKEGVHFVVDRNWSEQQDNCTLLNGANNSGFKNNHLGYGFSYVFKRKIFEKVRFPNVDFNEDGEFALRARDFFKVDGIADTKGIALHCLHPQSSSRCFPQYKIPNAIMGDCFPSFAAAVRKE